MPWRQRNAHVECWVVIRTILFQIQGNVFQTGKAERPSPQGFLEEITDLRGAANSVSFTHSSNNSICACCHLSEHNNHGRRRLSRLRAAVVSEGYLPVSDRRRPYPWQEDELEVRKLCTCSDCPPEVKPMLRA